MLKLRVMMWMIVCLSYMLHKGSQKVQMAHKKKKKIRNKDSEEHRESLQKVTTLIAGEMKESSTHLSQAMGQEIRDKQAELNDELNKINGLILAQRLRATILITRDTAVLNVFLSS